MTDVSTPHIRHLPTLVKTLRHLVSLNEPQHGGPYMGAAAQMVVQSMSSAADRIERLEEALSKIEDMLGTAIGAGAVDPQAYVGDGKAGRADRYAAAAFDIARNVL